jgi:hypothetical protein
MFGRGILAFAKESIVLTLVSSLVVLEALADMAICLSLLAWHVQLLVIENAGRKVQASMPKECVQTNP